MVAWRSCQMYLCIVPLNISIKFDAYQYHLKQLCFRGKRHAEVTPLVGQNQVVRLVLRLAGIFEKEPESVAEPEEESAFARLALGQPRPEDPVARPVVHVPPDEHHLALGNHPWMRYLNDVRVRLGLRDRVAQRITIS